MSAAKARQQLLPIYWIKSVNVEQIEGASTDGQPGQLALQFVCEADQIHGQSHQVIIGATLTTISDISSIIREHLLGEQRTT